MASHLFCALAILAFTFQDTIADLQPSLESFQLAPINNDFLSQEAENALKQEELDIISICTDFPFSFSSVIRNFIKSDCTSEEIQETMQKEIDQLKLDIESLKTFVEMYAKTVQPTDPSVESVRKRIIDTANKITELLQQITTKLSSPTELNDAVKMNFIQDEVKPALRDFENACIAQTKDILKNVLEDVKEEFPKPVEAVTDTAAVQ